MRTILSLFILVLLGIQVLAQDPVPNRFSYQAVLREANGDPMANQQDLNVTVKIFAGVPSEQPNPIFQEDHTSVNTNSNGLFTLTLGLGNNQVYGDLSSVSWTSGASHHLVVEVLDLVLDNLINSVPYALYSKEAHSVEIETDPLFSSWNKSTGITITESQISNLQDYLIDIKGEQIGDLSDVDLSGLGPDNILRYDETEEMWVIAELVDLETDPTVPQYVKEIETDDIDNWNEAHGWGDHSEEGYLTQETQSLGNVIAIGNSANNENIINLAEPVNPQDAATKAYVDALLARIEALEESDLLNNGFTDSRDGRRYKTVKIGNQIWMAENLKYLPSVVGPETGSLTIPYYYVYGYEGTDVNEAMAYEEEDINLYVTYGVLYNWPAAMANSASSSANPSGVQGVCPVGWHLPSDDEWTELTDYLGGMEVAGGKLKETGTTHWGSPNTGATNETGFTARPGGQRTSSSTFVNKTSAGFWWTATELDSHTENAKRRHMTYNHANVGTANVTKDYGYYVRCVKD